MSYENSVFSFLVMLQKLILSNSMVFSRIRYGNLVDFIVVGFKCESNIDDFPQFNFIRKILVEFIFCFIHNYNSVFAL